jgi:hypothetical protein
MATPRFHAGLFARLLLCVAFTFCQTVAVHARDAFVMLSGGHSPFDNNYSQYLQARAVVAWLEENYPRDSIWVFFGAGNLEGEKPLFCDVRRAINRDGMTINSWLPGALSRNRPARREVVLRALREEILPAVANGGTLYLFVGDHGSQGGTNSESIIDLWGLERDVQNERGWKTTRNESLGVTELRQTLAKGIGKGRVVFCMTQCHSGGFHHLAFPRAMTPNPKWFTSISPVAAPKKEETVFLRAAGFTATDERSLAAGCQPDPDPDRWVGYERFMPEHLLGMNMFTLERTRSGLRSFADAHVAATLVDQTIDKPYSTSEQYLERWANLIETRLVKSTNLTDKLKKHVAAYQRTVDGAAPKELDLGFRERQAMFRRFTQRIAEQNPAVKDLVLAGTRKDLEQAIGNSRTRSSTGTNSPPRSQQTTNQPTRTIAGTNQSPRSTTNAPSSRRTTTAPSETLKLWNETLRPAWTAALESNAVKEVVGAAVDFEKYLLGREAKGGDFFSSAARGRLQEEAFWRSGYSTPDQLDDSKAESVIQWGATRRTRIVGWARTCDDELVRAAGERLFQRGRRTNSPPVQAQASARTNQVSEVARPISKKVAVERTLFYRRVLAAWEFLLAVNERPAMARIRELTELERTPLPKPMAKRR